MIQIYYGDGKGKTTAAVGLAVRAAGSKLPVLFAQFLKDDSSGEIQVLRNISRIQTIHPRVFYGFVRSMSEEELEKTKEHYGEMLDEILGIIEGKLTDESGKIQGQELSGTQNISQKDTPRMLVVLDEILHAIHFELLSEDKVIDMLKRYQGQVEFVLTGRTPSHNILELANYVTEMRKEKHPYDQGVSARIGIEL